MDTEETKKTTITIDDFKKVEIRVGKILSAERIEGSEKLLKLLVDMGEAEPRQILSGIQKYFPEEQALVGVKCMFVANLEPRKMMGLESNGMLFALGGHDDVPFSLVVPQTDVPPGTPAN
jgi:methionyl-tRNA synthetase